MTGDRDNLSLFSAFVSGARGRVQSLDPEITKGALARFAIAIRPIASLEGGVFGVAKKFRSASAKAFGSFQNAFAPGP